MSCLIKFLSTIPEVKKSDRVLNLVLISQHIRLDIDFIQNESNDELKSDE